MDSLAATQRGEMGRGLSRPRDGFLLGGRNDGGTTSCPRTRVPRGGDMGRGLSRVPGMDSCSKAGMTVEPRRARARGYPEEGYGAGPLPRPRDGFLLGGRNDGGRLLPLTAPIPLTPAPSTGQALSLSKGVSGRSVALQPTLALPTPVENAAPCGRSRLSHVERYRMGE